MFRFEMERLHDYSDYRLPLSWFLQRASLIASLPTKMLFWWEVFQSGNISSDRMARYVLDRQDVRPSSCFHYQHCPGLPAETIWNQPVILEIYLVTGSQVRSLHQRSGCGLVLDHWIIRPLDHRMIIRSEMTLCFAWNEKEFAMWVLRNCWPSF